MTEPSKLANDDLDDQRSLYLHGSCHILAAALHRITGRPIKAAMAYDWNIEKDALVHCWIDLEGKDVLDASGITDTDQSLQCYPGGDEATVVTISEADLLALGEGRVPDEMAPKERQDFEQRLEAAGEYAKKLIDHVLSEVREDEEPQDYIDRISSMLSGEQPAPNQTPRAKP